MRRFWWACAALGWAFVVTVVAAYLEDHDHSEAVVPLAPGSLALVSPILAVPLLSCVFGVLAWRTRAVQLGAAILILGMCFFGYVLYLPAGALLVIGAVDQKATDS